MKKALKKLLKACEELGEDKVEEIMEEQYCDGAQGSGIVYATASSV